jgi:hypothetical protein
MLGKHPTTELYSPNPKIYYFNHKQYSNKVGGNIYQEKKLIHREKEGERLRLREREIERQWVREIDQNLIYGKKKLGR